MEENENVMPSCNVWKVGSRWSNEGDPKCCIFDIFQKTGVVFIGDNQDGSTHYVDRYKDKIKIGDYFAISDGLKLVAVAKVKNKVSHFQNLIKEDDIPEDSCFDYGHEKQRDNAVGWSVEIRYPIAGIVSNRKINLVQGRIYRMEKYAKDIIDIFEKYHI